MIPYSVKALIIEPGFHKTPITSTASVNPMLEKTWNSLSPEIKADFGDEFYQKGKQNMV